MTTKKYELLKNDTKTAPDGTTLYRVKYLKSFSAISKGELGGYIEKEANLSQEAFYREMRLTLKSDSNGKTKRF